MTDKIGIMDGAYFVGRNELLSWLNALLEINYKKVEQISNGAAMCQVMDAMYPNKSALSKVNYNATMDFEVLNNFKILQSEFKRVGVEKVVDIERLKQGRFQDNLEFFQWMKRYYDINHRSDVSSYRARERRREANCPEPKEIYGGLPLGRSSSSPAAAAAASKRQKYTPSTAVPSSVLSSSSTSAYHSTRPNSKNLVVPLAPAPLMAAASSVSRRPAQQQQQQQQQHTTFSVSTRPGRAGATGRSTQVNTSGVMGSKTGDDHGRNGSR